MVTDEITINQHEWLSEAVGIMDEREGCPERPYWLSGELPGGDDADEGLTYCWDCVQKQIKALTEGVAEHDLHAGGGYAGESDGCEHCEDCGKLLQYTLTGYGVSSELSHFSDVDATPFDWSSADECYHLARVAHGMLWQGNQARILINVLLKGKNFPESLKRIRAPKCDAVAC